MTPPRHFLTLMDLKADEIRSLIKRALDGYCATVFAYGQTGAGKTLTLCGDGAADPRLSSSRYGIVPRVCEELVNATHARRAPARSATRRTATSLSCGGPGEQL